VTNRGGGAQGDAICSKGGVDGELRLVEVKRGAGHDGVVGIVGADLGGGTIGGGLALELDCAHMNGSGP